MPCTNYEKKEIYLYGNRPSASFQYLFWNFLESEYTCFNLKIKGNTGTEYFKAKASFNVYYDTNSKTFNIRCLEISNICYQGENSVSSSDRTCEYEYLYDVTSSSECFMDKIKKENKTICEDNTRDIYAIIKTFINSFTFSYDSDNRATTLTADLTRGLEQINVHFKFSVNEYRKCGDLPFKDCCVPNRRFCFNLKKIYKLIIVAVVFYFIHAIGVQNSLFPEINYDLFEIIKNKLLKIMPVFNNLPTVDVSKINLPNLNNLPFMNFVNSFIENNKTEEQNELLNNEQLVESL